MLTPTTRLISAAVTAAALFTVSAVLWGRTPNAAAAAVFGVLFLIQAGIELYSILHG